MERIKRFIDFVNEEKVTPAGEDGYEDNFDADLEKEVEDYADKESEKCPRCGEHVDDCQCGSNDYWSTQTYHRVPKGELKKSKPKQEFKK
jgi:hypothetical protein